MILITDVISQSSNFCVIVLDETTYYISAFAVDSNGTIIDVQGKQITTSFVKIVEVDFTTGMHDFTYLGSSRNNLASQGRDNTHGLYITYNNTSNIQGFFQVPSSIYAQGQIKKIEFETYSSIQQTGPGFFEINSSIDRMNSSRNAFRVRYTSVSYGYNGTRSEVVVSGTPSGTFTTNFDFDNAKAYISTEPNNKLSISSSAITLFKSLRSQGKLSIALCKGGTSGTVYLRKVKFYMK